jgi:hypothetical protein
VVAVVAVVDGTLIALYRASTASAQLRTAASKRKAALVTAGSGGVGNATAKESEEAEELCFESELCAVFTSKVESVADAAEGDATLKACQRVVAVDTNERMRVP